MLVHKRPFSSYLLWCFLGGMLLTSCESTTGNAGADLVGAQAGDPVTVALPASQFNNISDPDITGGSGLVENWEGTSRVLAGFVDDPALGTIEALGHIDFAPVSTRSDAFDNASISFAEVILNLDYVYGDTLTTVVLQFYDLIEDWNALGVSADTSFPAGSFVTELSLSPRNQIVRFELPQDWIDANDDVLRSETFISDFHGFQLRATSGNAVLGFHHLASSMRLAVPGDTSLYALSKIVSSIDKADLNPPAGNVLLQDGATSRIQVDFDLENSELAGNPIHRSIFRITSDSPAIDTPVGFVRPRLTSLTLSYVSESPKIRTQVAAAQVDTDGNISFDNLAFNSILKRVLLGSLVDAVFEISVPTSDGTLNVLFVQDEQSSSPPRALLTVTNIN